MVIYTIGFTKKSAEQFFGLLKKNNVRYLIDIRLNNSSQLAGFAKGRDLKYFLRELLGIGYIHDTKLSPTKEILDDYKNKLISWNEYEKKFIKLLEERNIRNHVIDNLYEVLDGCCLLCSEETAEKCHRRLVAEYIQRVFCNEEIKIIHL